MTKPATFIILASLLAGGRATAQGLRPSSRFAIRPVVGAYVPTGKQHDALESAPLVGAQGSWKASANLAVVAFFGWAPTHDRAGAGTPKLDAFQYDLGVEGRSEELTTERVSPFVGAGVGGRRYSYRKPGVAATTNGDGYVALGFDAGTGAVGLRLEARDYVSRFQPLAGATGETRTRNDVALLTGVGVRF